MKQAKEKMMLRAQIDANIKRVYEEVVEEEVPDRFKDLIEQLRQKDDK